MLTRLGFSNFRAFRAGELPIKPITILIGANSIGKTTALQVPLLLKQTEEISGTEYNSSLKVHGKELNYGSQENVFRNRETEKGMSLRVEFESEHLYDEITGEIPYAFANYLEGLSQNISFLLRISNKKLRSVEKKIVRLLNPYLDINLAELLSAEDDFFDDLIEAKDIIVKHIGDDEAPLRARFGFGLRKESSGTVGSYLHPVAKSDLTRSLAAVKAFSKLKRNSFGLEFKFSTRKEPETATAGLNHLIWTSGISIYIPSVRKSDREVLYEFEFRDDERSESDKTYLDSVTIDSIRSTIISESDIGAYLNTISKFFDVKRDIFSIIIRRKSDSPYYFPNICKSVFTRIVDYASEYFDENSIGHIGPLRAHPKRIYTLDTAEAGSSQGDLLVELLRENEELRNSVNGWLKRFNIEIDVEQMVELIFQLQVSRKGVPFRMAITDVGFGISQILPILAEGLLSSENKVIVVEQPEIHLHPEAQSDLGDLFIDMAGISEQSSLGSRKFFLIETHSEYLLNRVRRRISDHSISHQDVAIIYVEQSDETVNLRQIVIPPDGSFEWPRGFMEASLEDSLAFARNRGTRA